MTKNTSNAIAAARAGGSARIDATSSPLVIGVTSHRNLLAAETLQIRASGYVLASPAHVVVPEGAAAHADLRLNATNDLEDQLSNARPAVAGESAQGVRLVRYL